jgi:hypothetical protein
MKNKENPHDPKTYLEYKVLSLNKDGTPDEKVPTKRRAVRISDRDAQINNLGVDRTKLWYELEQEPEPEPKKETKPKAAK